jgi:cytochrome c biogenesis protein CcmG, thiol:disulfide interchange protein DsbE
MDDPSPTPVPHPSALEPSFGSRRRRWRTLAIVLLVVGMLTSLLAFGLSRDPTAIRSPLLGKEAPVFSLRTLGGSDTVRLPDLRGQVVVVNFWASWCADCRIEHDALAAAWDRYRDKGVVLVGIAFQDQASASRSYLDTWGGDWPQLSDPGDATALAYGVYGVPETFVIAPDGRVAAKRVGAVSYTWLTSQIDALLAGVVG